jgi:hypothetical protein
MDERGASVPAGVYYCRFEVNGMRVSESKVVILR